MILAPPSGRRPGADALPCPPPRYATVNMSITKLNELNLKKHRVSSRLIIKSITLNTV